MIYLKRCHVCTVINQVGQIFEKGYLSNDKKSFVNGMSSPLAGVPWIDSEGKCRLLHPLKSKETIIF